MENGLLHNKPFIIEPISTPNKNITSTYDKKEESYLVNSKYKFPQYTFNSIVGIITEKKFILYKPNDKKVETELLFANIELYYDKFEKHLINTSAPFIFRKLESELVHFIKSHCNPLNLFIQLIFSDFYTKDQIIILVDLFLKVCGFRGIQLLQIGFCIGIKLRKSTLALEYVNHITGYTFIDDYTTVDSFCTDNIVSIIPNISLADNEDIADEFCRLKTLNYNNKFSCKKCDVKEDSIDKIYKHLERDHKIKDNTQEWVYELKNKSFNELIEFIFTNKLKKLENNKYTVQLNFDTTNNIISESNTSINYIIIQPKDLLSSAIIFKELDTSKELWLTDKEWEIGRKRILKEKVLFYI